MAEPRGVSYSSRNKLSPGLKAGARQREAALVQSLSKRAGVRTGALPSGHHLRVLSVAPELRASCLLHYPFHSHEMGPHCSPLSSPYTPTRKTQGSHPVQHPKLPREPHADKAMMISGQLIQFPLPQETLCSDQGQDSPLQDKVQQVSNSSQRLRGLHCLHCCHLRARPQGVSGELCKLGRWGARATLCPAGW